MLVLVGVGFVANLWITYQAAVLARRLAKANIDIEDNYNSKSPAPKFGRTLWGLWGGCAITFLVATAIRPTVFGPLLEAPFMIASTVWGYLIGVSIPKQLARFVHPVVTCAVFSSLSAGAYGMLEGKGWNGGLNAYLTRDHLSWGAGDWLMSFLGVVILSFAFIIAAEGEVLIQHYQDIGVAVLSCSIFSMVSTALVGRILFLNPNFTLALVPRSVTVALAIPIAKTLGTPNIPITTAAVVFTGLMGANFSSLLLDRLSANDPILRGVTAASCGHGLATAALATSEPETLPFCSLAYVLTGVLSVVIVSIPLVKVGLISIAGQH